MKKATAYIGMKLGALTLVEATDARSRGHVVYKWRCDCGGDFYAHVQNIRLAKFPSCGCQTKRLISAARTSHGASKKGSPMYSMYIVWRAMFWRCENASRRDFKNYGGRGIKVCQRWHSFDCFVADMGIRPSEKHSIDRIDVNGDYEPGNCRWATTTEQANNKRTSRFLAFDGREMTVSQWAREVGIGNDTLRLRLAKGWSIERALTVPAMRRGPNRIEVAA